MRTFNNVTRIELDYSLEDLVQAILGRALKDLSLTHSGISRRAFMMDRNLTSEERKALNEKLAPFAIQLAANESVALVGQIKYYVRKAVTDGQLRKKNLSTILTEKLGYSYSHLSSIFSKKTYTSIENFHIFVKIERAKELLAQKNRTVSDVAFEMDYSSVSHLSRQFKNVTGLTVTQYLKLIKSRTGYN